MSDSAYSLVWRPWQERIGQVRDTRRDVEVEQPEWMPRGVRDWKRLDGGLGIQVSFCS